MNHRDCREILVLDTVHGGDILAERLNQVGHEARALHPYDGESTDLTGYDALVSPVHMYPGCSELRQAREQGVPVYTHHQATRYIIKSLDLDTLAGCTVEVTGTVGKTTTTLLLMRMLVGEGYDVAAHTSNGLYHNQDDLGRQYSVAPYGTILALEKAGELDLDVDFWLSEVSIGFIGIADLASLTSTKEDYLIADETKKASKTKKRSFRNLDEECLLNTPRETGRSTNTHGDLETGFDGENLSIEYKVRSLGGVNSGEIDAYLPLYPYFRDSVRMAVITAASLGCSQQAISDVLDGFTGVPGRMQTLEIEGRTLVDNSCAGTRVSSLDKYLSMLEDDPSVDMDRVVVLVGEDQENICEEMDPGRVKSVVERHRFSRLITVGRKHRDIGVNFDGVDEALDHALEKSSPGDILLNFVKAFR
ncbi:MAG: hypothetical protein EF811_02920 [Methanonatronarchaeia archaeon]|nr:MAG: hypothetical protein EF811_02920 [Methanonatronarchaeia archaeon]